jgi:hypothetical protein
VAAQVVYVHGGLYQLFWLTHILGVILQTRQYKTNEVILNECLVRAKRLDGAQSLTPPKIATLTFEPAVMFPTIGGTSSHEKSYQRIPRIYDKSVRRVLSRSL